MSIGASNDFLLDSDLLNGLDSLDSDKAALLALLLAEQDAAPVQPAVPARIERTHAGRAPLSSAQQRLWLLYCLDPDSAAYNLTSAFQVTGRLDVAALQAAVAGLVARHEILRTTFEEVVGRACTHARHQDSFGEEDVGHGNTCPTYTAQIIHPTLAIPLVVEDLTNLSAGEREAEIRRRLNEEARRPFDLSHGPALRLRVLRLGEDSHVLVIAAHHIVYDGWSLSIFVRELAELYEAHRDRRLVALPPPALQYADYALWESRQDFSQIVEERARALAGAPYLELPTDRPTPIQPQWAGAFVDFELPGELTARIRRLGRSENATLFTTLLAVFETLLHRYTGQVDFLLGVPVANRRRPEIEGLIGFFVNTLAVRADMSGDPTFRDVLIRARHAVDDAFERQEAPFERIVQVLHPERGAQQMPLVRVMFGLQNAPMGHLALRGLDLAPVRIERRSAKFDLVFLIHETADGLGGELEYNADVFDESTIRRVLGHYRVLLEAVAAEPDARIAALPLLTEAEQHQLARWNQTAAAYPREAGIPGCFEQQARRTPGAVAVDFGGQRLTYGELDQRANRLAHRLRAAGVGLETPVAINVPRSVDLIVGLLAILKAGGYYVPLDPAYPAERLTLMLNDCGARVLLTRGDVADPALGTNIDGSGRKASFEHPHPNPLPGGEGAKCGLTNGLIERICLDQADAYVGPGDQAPKGPAPTGDSLAYVIYTSGSTGIPKGVAVPHRAVLRLVLNTDYVDFRAGDRIAQASNASFDAATFEIWGALLNGARLVGVERDIALSPPQFAAVLREQEITTLFLTTALFNQMAREAPGAFGTLRHVLFGGEQVDPQRVREVLRDGPPTRLLHVYGPTENTTFSTWHLVEAVPEDAATVPIGQPIANSTAYVLDSRLQPLPVGVPGELYVGGEGLARGYLGQPELTAERFVEVASKDVASSLTTKDLAGNNFPVLKRSPGRSGTYSCPTLLDPGDGVGHEYLPDLRHSASSLTTLYKTGDIALRQPDGSIVFVGRRDHQVKIRGFRVELGEIEAALLAHPAVREAVAVFAGGRLGAYLVANDTAAAPASAELRRHLAQTLPDYMIPSDFLALDALPLNVNGKVDRERLPEIPRGGAEPAAATGPRGATEEILAGLWAKVLGLADVGDGDNFFELGGHSLLATQVISRIRETFGVELPLRALFQSPTVAGLTGQIEAARRQANGAPPVIRPVPRTSAPALSFAQERLWFLDQLEPGNPFYNVPIALTLTGPLDVTALQRSIEAVAQRHEVLRTTFPAVDGKPTQAIAATAVVALPVLDVAGGEDEAARLMAEEARQPFDLAAGPLLRTRLLRLGADRHVLLFTLHHIIADGWSLGVLVNELVPLYRHFRSAAGRDARSPAFRRKPTGEAPAEAGTTSAAPAEAGTTNVVDPSALPLPPLAIQYADFAAWQRDWLGGGVMEAQFAYWREQLRDAPPVLDLPTDRPRPPVQSYRGSSVHFRVEATVADALRKLSRRGEATLFMALLAAFATLLHRYSGQDDLVIGSPIANRHRGEVEPLIGFFVNTLALRVNLHDNPAFTDLLAQVRRTALDAYAHQDLPFEKLVDELQPDRDLSLNPLFQVMFALQNAPLERLALAELDAELIEAPHQMALFDLVLDMWEAEGALAGVLEYNTDLFDEASVQRLVGNFQTLLQSIAADAARPVDALPWLTEAERDALLAMGAGPRRDYPVDQTLHALFERTAAAHPKRIAAVHNGARVSYAEIEARANRIAHRLRRMGVGANDFVAILDQRGPDVLAAMLGILKAGGAFLPLDPAYPPERIRYMLADSGVRVLVSRTARLAELPTDAYTGQTVRLDADDWADEPATPPAPLSGPTDLAYMLYTSGSTGLPKGAMIRHDGAVNHIHAEFELLAFHRGTAFLQSAPSSSDISVWQFLAPGLIGGRTVIVDYETVCDPAALLRTLREESITLIELVPAVMKAFLDHAGRLSPEERALPSLEWAMVTGEAANPALVNQWLSTYPGIKLVNAYGPTEAADDISQSVLDRPLASDRAAVPIGRPLANLTLYVLDRQLSLVPQGVPGEICVSGIGVGAGYWRNEARTRESFVPNPYAGGGRGEVIYRTGDLGRWLPDGTLECLERLDDQVKLRGFRIELGEIEGVLNAHPAVREAVAVIHGEGADDKRLAAYLVPDGESAEVRARLDALRREQVELWQDLHEDSYRDELLRGDVTFNVIGWDSNYTGQPLPEADMREYVGFTVERIRSLNPRRVLEIGCGTGLIMFPLLPHCESYTGTDLSHVSIDRLRALRDSPELRARIPGLDRAELLSRRADDTDWLVPGAFDTVVFPSVVQYFPGIDYFLAVLDGLFNKALAAGGSIFVGDVRSLPLLEAFHADVQLYKAAPTDSAAEVAERTRQRVAQEQEMAIDPAFFLALKQRYPAIAQVDILPKRGFHHNEMTRFRYDVLIRTGAAAEPVAEFDWIDWRQTRPAVDALRRRLSEERPAALALRRIANARVAAALSVVDALRPGQRAEGTAAEIQARAAAASGGIEPEDLWRLGRELGYRVDLSLARGYADGGFDAVFRPLEEAGGSGLQPATAVFDRGLKPTPTTSTPKPWSRYANNPLHEKLARRLAPDLREFLKDRLPHYMVPSHFAVLTGLPLTPAGKVDRRALPPPDASEQVSDHAYVAPRNATEQALARIWAEILGLSRVGIRHNFFELGGHSLKATQVVSRIQRELSAQVALRDVFAHPTIAELAPRLAVADTAAPVAIPKVPDAADYPLSHAQRRLWVLAQLEGASVAYNMPMALLIEGPVDAAAFGAAFARLVERHEALRTAFVAPDGVPRQRVLPAGGAVLDWVDLSHTADPDEAARTRALADAATPFDLERGLPVRATLLRLGAARQVLLLNMHHIVSDEWSLNVMVREFVQLYAALVQGQPPDLPPLGLQYRDYACWQESYLASAAATAHRAYWHGKLAGHLPLLNLATDFPRPPIKTYRGRAYTFRLASRQTAGLAALARDRQASLFMVLAAAVKALLYRYTGQEDILIGFPIAGRDHPDLENQIGFYVNTLPLRDEVRGAEPFSALLERVKATATEAYEHQAYPFDRLVDELDVARDVGRSPMFDVVIVMQNAGAAAPPIAGLGVRPFLREYESSKFDLGFVFEERDGELRVDLAYNTDLFLPARIERMASHFRELAAGIVADAATPVDRLPMLPEDERRLILNEWTPAPVVQPKGPTLVGGFEAQAARSPERLAVVGPAVGADFAPTEATPRRTLTYGELNAQANRLAHRLRRMGAGPETLVGLCLPRSPDLVVGLLGILKAGAAYLPLDTAHPAERWAFMLSDAQVAVVVTDGALADRFAGTTATPLCLDTEAAALAAESPDNPAPLAGPDHLAYVIYTSGSTGRPKGVAVTHHNVARLFAATESLFGFNEFDVWSLFHSAAFDFSVWELWGALLYGGRVVVVPHWVSRVPQAFLDLLAREGVTVLNQTPSAFRQLVQADEDAGGAAGLALRYVIFGGEALDLKSLRPWFDRHGDQWPRLVNMYGITETTVHVTYRPLSRADVDAPGSLIGRALPDLALYLLDAHRQPVPIGVAGEIYVGGGGVSRGYLNRPELTAERFIPVGRACIPMPDALGEAMASGMGTCPTYNCLYRSGDLGRYLPNGDIEYLGRIDQQVQIRGFRVELGEIEAALAEHPEVREAVVLAQGEGSQMRLVGYVIPAAGATPAADTLRRHLRTRLPEYMVPAALIALDAFPLTANGKLDRAALPSPEEVRANDTAAAAPYAEPASEMEATIAALFGEVLGGARVGLHDNFFDLGANSLVLVQVQRRLRQALGREVPVILLFQFPTVAALAARLAEPDAQPGETTAVRQAQDRAAQRKAARATRRTPSR